MNLNKSTRYAMHAAMELASAGGQPVTAAQIAERYEIPENVVAKVLQQLARVGVVRGVRGIGGGYLLARPAGEVSLQQIIDIFEPKPDPDTCMLRERSGAVCPAREGGTCRLRRIFQTVGETTREAFSSVDLATLVNS